MSALHCCHSFVCSDCSVLFLPGVDLCFSHMTRDIARTMVYRRGGELTTGSRSALPGLRVSNHGSVDKDLSTDVYLLKLGWPGV